MLQKRENAHLERCNLRISEEVLNAIDLVRSSRAGFVSRNSWIAEAIIEKLNRAGVDAPLGKGANDA